MKLPGSSIDASIPVNQQVKYEHRIFSINAVRVLRSDVTRTRIQSGARLLQHLVPEYGDRSAMIVPGSQSHPSVIKRIEMGLTDLGFRRIEDGVWARPINSEVTEIVGHGVANDRRRIVGRARNRGSNNDLVQRTLRDLRGLAPGTESDSTFGCDLAHVVRGPADSGWTFTLGDIQSDPAETLLRFLQESALPLLDQFRTIDDLYAMIEGRMARRSSDPFVMNEKFVVPVVLLLQRRYDRLSIYVEEQLKSLEADSHSSMPLYLAYQSFADRLKRRECSTRPHGRGASAARPRVPVAASALSSESSIGRG